MFCGRVIFEVTIIITLIFAVVGSGATGRYYRSSSLATFNAAFIGSFPGANGSDIEERVPLLIEQVKMYRLALNRRNIDIFFAFYY